MRKQLLGLMLPVLILVVIAAGQTQNTTTGASGHATLQRVDVLRGDDGISVEITAHGLVAPKLSTLESPARWPRRRWWSIGYPRERQKPVPRQDRPPAG